MLNKVVVAAAGRGTRMLHLSQEKPKHLIEINGHPFLYYLLNNLKAAGFTEIIMVIGYKKEIMEKFLNTYAGEFKITIVNQFDMLGDKYGTLCPIECVKDLIKTDESFITVYGDNLYSINDLKKFFIDDEFNYISGLKHPEPQKYGVLIRDGEDYLDRIIEKPTTFVGDLINTGLYKFTPSIFKKLPLIQKSPRGEFELTDAINLLAKEKRVKIKEIEDYWLDFGKPEDVQTISEFLNHAQ
ncbi:MAG: sugar phosphate nucleotidyltransferase [Patescibacteria group bacterium]|jgi:bifunctional UDP-N-acetylglucosamine pyrophosphorylase/glucosamine-1-phosphate N-acetyltransferase